MPKMQSGVISVKFITTSQGFTLITFMSWSYLWIFIKISSRLKKSHMNEHACILHRNISLQICARLSKSHSNTAFENTCFTTSPDSVVERATWLFTGGCDAARQTTVSEGVIWMHCIWVQQCTAAPKKPLISGKCSISAISKILS